MTTKQYIQNIRDYLVEEYGAVKPEWELTLILLQNTIERYNRVAKIIDKEGIYDSTRGVKNPLLSTEKDLLATILKLTQKIGCSPWDASKIKNSPEDDTESFLDSLTGGNDE